MEKINISWENLENLTAPQFEWTNYTAKEFVSYIPENANNFTAGSFGLISLLAYGFFLIWALTDDTQFGRLRYSYIRGTGIALGMTTQIGIILLMLGYITNYIHVGFLFTLFILFLIYTFVKNPN